MAGLGAAAQFAKVGLVLPELESMYPSAGASLGFLVSSLGLVQGASFASVPQLNPSSSGQALANGTLAQAGNLGNSLGTPIVLMVLAVGGLNSVMAVVVFCFAAAIGAHGFLARRRKVA